MQFNKTTVADTKMSVQIVHLPQKFTREWVEKNSNFLKNPYKTLKLDFTNTQVIDSSGISFLHILDRLYHKAGHALVFRNVSKEILSSITGWSTTDEFQAATSRKTNFFEIIGDNAINLATEGIQALSMLVEILYWGTIGFLSRRDYRRGITGEQMYQLGYKAIIIVGLLSFLIGIVLSIQTARQLQQLGADIFLVSLIGMSMVREIGPLMTAIVLAGRTGSATTAEIATMGVQEELDALRTMGLNPIQFVVVPKFWAISITMPVLSIFSVAAGIFGGFLISLFSLDISPALFWSELEKGISIKDFMAGFIKSVVFSWLIIWIGAYYGFKVRGGAEEVGRETTASVVTSIFVIIIADAIFSFII